MKIPSPEILDISEEIRRDMFKPREENIDPYTLPTFPTDVNHDDCSSVNPSKIPLERE